MLGGCTTQAWTPADLQLDISDSNFVDTDRVRICVEDFGMREIALGAGLVAFTGVAPETEISVTVDMLSSEHSDSGGGAETSRSGRAGPVILGPEQPWSESPWSLCEDQTDCLACQSPGERVPTGADSVILAIRFLP